MLSFALAVILVNLFFMCLLFSIRHIIAITTPVLLMTVLVAFLCTIALPYMMAILDYTQLAVTLFVIIFFFSVLLTLANKKYFLPKLSAAHTNHPDGEEKQNDDLNNADEIPLLQMTTEATHEQFEQKATNIMCAEVEQTPSSTTELEPAAAKDREKAAPQPEFMHPVLEITNSFTSETEEKTEMTGYIEKPEYRQDEQMPTIETEPVPVLELELELELEPEPESVLEPGSALEPEPVPVPEPAAIFAYEENKTIPPKTKHWHQDFISTEPTKPDSNGIETNQTNLNRLIELGFASKHNGDYLGAAMTFFKVLQMQPETKLALLLAVEISDIYREAGQFWQATEILDILLKSWRTDLDVEKVEMLELKISQLQELL